MLKFLNKSRKNNNLRKVPFTKPVFYSTKIIIKFNIQIKFIELLILINEKNTNYTK